MADLKAYGLAISFAAAALWAVVVVFNNRASEKIVTAALPLATGALVAVFLAVYVFAVQPPILLKFPVCFIVRLPQGTPAVGLPILWSGRFVDPFGKETAFRDEHPELFQNRGLAS